MAKIYPLTDIEIKQAKPKEKQYILADGGGLQLRIKPNGSKLWQLRYTNPYTKKPALMGLGAYPAVSLADARKCRYEARALLAKGLSPKEERDIKQQLLNEAQKNTFEVVASKWFEVKKTKVKQGTANDIWRSFELHIFPQLGKMPLDKISAPKAISVINSVSAKGSLETVKRLCQRINEIMVFAVNTGLVNHNPLAGISEAFVKPKKKHMPTLKPDELPALMRALNTASIRIVTRGLIEWQLHTICRPGEAAKAKWKDIDFENKVWNRPKESMKMNRAHSIPLTKQTIALLHYLKPISSNGEFIFPSNNNPRKHANEATANSAITRMGFKGRLVAHGLRSLASTTLNQQGFNGDLIESCLAHTDKNEVRKAYNHSDYLDRRREIMDWWSNHIEQASIGNMSLCNMSLCDMNLCDIAG